MMVSTRHFGRALAQRPALQLSGTTFAAVALILRERKNGLEVLLIQRAKSAADPWSGHLAFPGGRRDPADVSLYDTARRETLEELGIDLGRVATPLGALDQLQTRPQIARDMVIAPFVFALDQEPALQLNREEVERVLWLELSPLLAGQQQAEFHLERDGQRHSMPGYRVEDEVLWGMSYQMLNSLLQLADRSER
jgi:8-oxo-dGTP pyrophosphatase MutT (NUDIX family)